MATQKQKDFYENISGRSILIDTLEISHSKFSKTYRLCRDKENSIYTIETGEKVEFEAVNFNLSIPSFSAELSNTLKFEIDLINYGLVSELEKILNSYNEEPILIIQRSFEKGNSDFPIFGPTYFQTTDFRIFKNNLTVSAKTHEFVNLKWPVRKFTDEDFPGQQYL